MELRELGLLLEEPVERRVEVLQLLLEGLAVGFPDPVEFLFQLGEFGTVFVVGRPSLVLSVEPVAAVEEVVVYEPADPEVPGEPVLLVFVRTEPKAVSIMGQGHWFMPVLRSCIII